MRGDRPHRRGRRLPDRLHLPADRRQRAGERAASAPRRDARGLRAPLRRVPRRGPSGGHPPDRGVARRPARGGRGAAERRRRGFRSTSGSARPYGNSRGPTWPGSGGRSRGSSLRGGDLSKSFDLPDQEPVGLGLDDALLLPAAHDPDRRLAHPGTRTGIVGRCAKFGIPGSVRGPSGKRLACLLSRHGGRGWTHAMSTWWIDGQGWIEKAAEWVQPIVKSFFDALGPSRRDIKNFLHGTWLGHPLHPVMTDIPLGAWTVTLLLDALSKKVSGSRPDRPAPPTRAWRWGSPARSGRPRPD